MALCALSVHLIATGRPAGWVLSDTDLQAVLVCAVVDERGEIHALTLDADGHPVPAGREVPSVKPAVRRLLAAEPVVGWCAERPPLWLAVVARIMTARPWDRATRVLPFGTDALAMIRDMGVSIAPPTHESLGAGPVFLFPGQGSFDLDMLRAVGRADAACVSVLAAADEASQSLLGAPVSALVDEPDPIKAETLLDLHPDLEQFGIFVTGVCAATLLRARGTLPVACAGHSFGEIAALVVAGALDLKAGARVVAKRVEATWQGMPGRMAAVMAGPDVVAPVLADMPASTRPVIAAVNHPGQTVVAGTEAAVQGLEATLRGKITVVRVRSRWAYHTLLLAPSVGPFALALRDETLRLPDVPVYSTGDGVWVGHGFALDRSLPDHLVAPLDFQGAAQHLVRQGATAFAECGPGKTLSRMMEKNAGAHAVTALPFTQWHDDLARLTPAVQRAAVASAPARAVAKPA